MLPTRTAIKCCRPDLQTQPNIIWLVMYLNMSATMIPRYAHKMVNVASPKTHLPPSYCPWKFLPWSAFLRRTKGLWLPRCYRFEWTKVMVRWTEFQPPLRNSKGSYGKGAPRSEEHGGGSPGCAKRHGKLWAELSKTWTISPRRPFGVMRIKEWPGWERTVQERLRRLVESTSWATVEAGTRGGNPFLLRVALLAL